MTGEWNITTNYSMPLFSDVLIHFTSDQFIRKRGFKLFFHEGKNKYVKVCLIVNNISQKIYPFQNICFVA